MSVESETAGGEYPPPESCRNAQEYVLKRLKDLGEPRRPSQLAGEYDCSAAYMRSVFKDLYDSGEIDRVSHGEYVYSGADWNGGANSDLPAVSEPPVADLSGDGDDEVGQSCDDVDDKTDEPAGIPIPVDPLVLYVVVGLIFVVLVYSSYSGTGDSESDEDVETEEPIERGLVEGVA